MPARKRTTRKRTTRRKRTPLQIQKSKLALAKRARNAAENKMEALAYKVERVGSLKGRTGTAAQRSNYNKLNEQLRKSIKQFEQKAKTTRQLHRRFRGK